MSVLGCADSYKAVIHWRGGGQVFLPLDKITALSWERLLSDTSTASVTVPVQGQTEGCCTLLGTVTEWCHELSIYRDDALIWQGPVTEVVYSRTEVTITASDVTAWLAKLANYVNISYTGIDATLVAYNIIRANLNAALSTPHDYPDMLSYIVRENCGSTPTYKKGRWIEFVLTIVEDLASYGFQYTCVGRSLYLRDIKTATSTVQARLSGEHFLGDGVTVTRNGDGAVTNGFATNQTADTTTGIWTGSVYVATTLNTPYGRLDNVANLSDADATTAQLRAAALALIGSRYPAPVVLDVPNGSQLSPTAPVTITQLVPGETFDVAMTDFCYPVQQGFRLTNVAGSWDGSTEKITATMSSLSVTAEDTEE